MSIDAEASLSVSIRHDGVEDILWELPGSHGKEWTYGRVRLYTFFLTTNRWVVR